MRQHVLRHKDRILEECGAYIVKDPKAQKGCWRKLFEKPENPLYLEVGSGKGQFIAGLAAAHPEANFLACEGAVNVYPRILQKIQAGELANLLLISEYIILPADYFAEGELSGVFLNFSDPWPKDRYEKRRLTHHEKLLQYREIMTPGTTLQFKTDNDELFDWSLEELAKAALEPEFISRDVHGLRTEIDGDRKAASIGEIRSYEQTTEYEDKFVSENKTINYLRIRF